MADDPKEKSSEQGQKPGQESEPQGHEQDPSKRNPSRQDLDEEEDQQKGDKRRAS